MDQPYIVCQHANRQACRINTPFQSLTNLPLCITALNSKNNHTIGEQCSLSISHVPHTFVPVAVALNLWIIPSNCKTLGSTITIIRPNKATSTVPCQQPFHILRLSPACSATSRYFHLPQCYEDHTMMMNVSLDTVNINTINISTLDFRIWQHFNRNWTPPHLQKMGNVPKGPVTQLYKHMIDTSEPVHSFTTMNDDKDHIRKSTHTNYHL